MHLSYIRDDIKRLSKEVGLEDERLRNAINFGNTLGHLTVLDRDRLSSVTSLQKNKCSIGIDWQAPAVRHERDFNFNQPKTKNPVYNPVHTAEWYYERGSNRLKVRCYLRKSKVRDDGDWFLQCPNLQAHQQIPCVVRIDVQDKTKALQEIVFFTAIRKTARLVSIEQFIGKGAVHYLSVTYVPVKLEEIITKLKRLHKLLPHEAAEAGFGPMCKTYEDMGYPVRVSVTLNDGHTDVQHEDTPPQNVPEDQQIVDGPPDDGAALVSPPPRADIVSAMSMASDAWDHGFDIQQQYEEAAVSTSAAARIDQEDALTLRLINDADHLRDENKHLLEELDRLRKENCRQDTMISQLQAQLHKGRSTSDGAAQTPKRGIDGPSTSEKRQRFSDLATGEADSQLA